MSGEAMVLAGRAMELQSAGALGEAIAVYRRAIELDGDRSAAIQFNLGAALAAHGDATGAEAAYRRALELDPSHVYAHDNLGALLQADGRLDEAMACYRRALALDPTNAWAHAALGALLLAIDDTEAAVASLGAAVALDATDANSLVSLGMAQIVLHRWQEAQQSFRGALALQPRDRATAQFNLGVALDGEGLHEQAVDAYTEGLGIEPSNADALRNLGAVFTKLDRMEEALVAYTRAVDADPDDAVSRHLVAAMRGDDTPRAPREYVRRVFDDYAHSYDTHLLDKLEYRAPDSIRALVDQLCAAPVETALDIGCGTGLVGVRLRDRVGVLHGVDLSSKMIARAEATGVYDALYIGDIVEFLQSSDALAYDLVTAADVLIYVGDLVELMRAVAARLAVAGRFVFTVESLDAGDYRLLDSGRYAHSADYIARLATDSHLTVLASEPLALRLQRDTRVNGRLFAVG